MEVNERYVVLATSSKPELTAAVSGSFSGPQEQTVNELADSDQRGRLRNGNPLTQPGSGRLKQRLHPVQLGLRR